MGLGQPRVQQHADQAADEDAGGDQQAYDKSIHLPTIGRTSADRSGDCSSTPAAGVWSGVLPQPKVAMAKPSERTKFNRRTITFAGQTAGELAAGSGSAS
jgi:hypothetical protein